MPIMTYCWIACAGYLLGSIPFGYLLVRLFRNEDIREMGSGNIGPTNVIRPGAKGLGLLTFLLDACIGHVARAGGVGAVQAAGLLPEGAHDPRAGPAGRAVRGGRLPGLPR